MTVTSLSGSPRDRFDWTPFLDMSRTQLLSEYVDCATAIANVIDEIAFLRCEEKRDKHQDQTPRIEQEAVRDILIEKKFMIRALLDHTHRNGQPS